MITEIFGKKVGMTQIFDEKSDLVPVTLIKVGPCVALEEKDVANKKIVKIGYEEVTKDKQKKKPLAGYFNKLGTSYFKTVKEVVKASADAVEKGSTFDAKIFEVNEKVDVIGTTVGRGFQGGMKRHNWSGQPAAHGHMMHRRPGSIGCRAQPGEVIKGKTMPGHMGNVRRTTKNLKIVKVDSENNLIYVTGSCAGCKNSTVIIRKIGAK